MEETEWRVGEEGGLEEVLEIIPPPLQLCGDKETISFVLLLPEYLNGRAVSVREGRGQVTRD